MTAHWQESYYEFWQKFTEFGELPEVAGKYVGKNCLIIGPGRCVWNDIQKIDWLQYDIMAVNDVGMHFPGRIHHWYSNDVKQLVHWIPARRPAYKKEFNPPKIHSCNRGVTYFWPWPGHGTSGLNAVYTALALGYDNVTLAGIPLDDSGHYFDPPWVKTNFSNEVPERQNPQDPRLRGMKWWKNAKNQWFDGRVSSLSGRTKELLDE